MSHQKCGLFRSIFKGGTNYLKTDNFNSSQYTADNMDSRCEEAPWPIMVPIGMGPGDLFPTDQTLIA